MTIDVDALTLETLSEPSKDNPRLDQFKVLELNVDMQPISYYPLSLRPWQWVMFLIAKGMVTGQDRLRVVDVYDDVIVHTAREEFNLPSVIAHVQYIPPPKKIPFTKFNVYLRDEFRCQYTGEYLKAKELSFDHVVPKSRGGGTTWENIVTCSKKLNEYKDNRTPKEAGLTLRKKPQEPTAYELRDKGRMYPPSYMHPAWDPYLFFKEETAMM